MPVKPFQRRLPAGALEYLRTMPRWWRDVLTFRFEDERGIAQPLLIAFRDGYLNVYAEGQSVLKVKFQARPTGDVDLRCRIHRKYVHGPQAGNGYDIFDGAQIVGTDKAAVIATYDGPDTLRRWVQAARRYAGDEKRGVAVIAANHPDVVDVEMGLPANAPVGDQAKIASRMDIVALEQHEGVRLAFYEAKLFSNKELRADDLRPRVLGQLRRYRAYVAAPDRHAEVITAYQNACTLLTEVAAMRGTEPAPLMRAVADGVPLSLDPEPRLVVFGYRPEQVAPGSSWQRHAEVLRNGGVALLLGVAPQDIMLRRPERSVATAPGGH